MSIENAFNLLIKLHSRRATLVRPQSVGSDLEYEISISPSNYFRKLETVEDVTGRGREFVISKKDLESAGLSGPIKRGDFLDDADLGSMSISEVREMFSFGGKIIGYRIRCE